MSEYDSVTLEQEVFDRWLHMYKKGKLTRREFGLVVATMAGALVSACAPSAPPMPTATSAKTTAPAPAATSAPAPSKSTKDTLVVAFASDQTTLDPHMHNVRDLILIHYQIHSNLGVRDLTTMKIAPHLATSWKPIEPTVWELELRKDVKFHNGDPFDAESVKFSWERVINPAQKSPQAGNHAQIKGVEIVDPYKVRVHTKAPYPVFVERLQNLQMISPKYTKEKGDAYIAEHPNGTGPYKFVEWKKGQYWLFERWDDYWGPKGGFPKMMIRIIPEVSTRIAELLGGRVDIIRGVPTDQMATINNSGVAAAIPQRILRTAFIMLDSAGRSGPSPLMDKRVRNAINHAVPIDSYIKTLQPGGDRTPALVNPMHFGFDPTIKPHEYDVDLAKKLMAEAGYANGFEARLLTAEGNLMPNARMFEQAFQRDMAKIGIKVDINIVSGTTFQDMVVTKRQGGPMWFDSWGSYSVFDADGILYDVLHSTGVYSYFANPQFDKLIEEARSILDEGRRKELYSQAQKIIREEAPVVFLWGLHGIWGISKAVKFQPPADEIDRYYEAKPA